MSSVDFNFGVYSSFDKSIASASTKRCGRPSSSSAFARSFHLPPVKTILFNEQSSASRAKHDQTHQAANPISSGNQRVRLIIIFSAARKPQKGDNSLETGATVRPPSEPTIAVLTLLSFVRSFFVKKTICSKSRIVTSEVSLPCEMPIKTSALRVYLSFRLEALLVLFRNQKGYCPLADQNVAPFRVCSLI